MARPKGSPDLTPAIRGGLLRALKIIDDSKKPMSTRWVEAFEKDFLATMTVASRFIDKNVNLEHSGTVTHNTNQMSEELLRDVIKTKRLQAAANG